MVNNKEYKKIKKTVFKPKEKWKNRFIFVMLEEFRKNFFKKEKCTNVVTNDIEKATKMLRQYIIKYGLMEEETTE